MSDSEREFFIDIFKQADKNGNGYISKAEALELFKKSNLEEQYVVGIMGICDLNKNEKYVQNEFILAMFLISKVLAGAKLPESLSQQLINSASVNSTTESQNTDNNNNTNTLNNNNTINNTNNNENNNNNLHNTHNNNFSTSENHFNNNENFNNNGNLNTNPNTNPENNNNNNHPSQSSSVQNDHQVVNPNNPYSPNLDNLFNFSQQQPSHYPLQQDPPLPQQYIDPQQQQQTSHQSNLFSNNNTNTNTNNPNIGNVSAPVHHNLQQQELPNFNLEVSVQKPSTQVDHSIFVNNDTSVSDVNFFF